MSQNIQIIARREDPFARVTKSMLDDPRLSWRAKGIMAYLLGKPPEWKMRVADLTNHAPEGETATRRALNELRAFGYASLSQSRLSSGRMGEWVWKICDYPIFAPDVEKPNPVAPNPVNRHHSKKDENKNDLTKNSTKDDNFFEKKAVVHFSQIEYPSESQLEEFIEENELDGLVNGRQDLHGDLVRADWRDGKGRKIKNWQAYITGLNETIINAAPNARGR